MIEYVNRALVIFIIALLTAIFCIFSAVAMEWDRMRCEKSVSECDRVQ